MGLWGKTERGDRGFAPCVDTDVQVAVVMSLLPHLFISRGYQLWMCGDQPTFRKVLLNETTVIRA